MRRSIRCVGRTLQFDLERVVSLGNRLVKHYLRRTWLPQLMKADIQSLRSTDRRHPPRRLRRRHACEEVQIEGTRCVWLDRERAGNGVIVYLHGGGYIF